MHRSIPDDAEQAGSRWARMDSQHPSINQSNSECRLISHSFLVPLVITFLNDGTVLGRLLHVCKAMNLRIGGYTVKKPVKLVIARDLVRDSCYFPVIITELDGVEDEDLSVFASLTSVRFADDYAGTITLPDTITELVMPRLWNSLLTRDLLPGQLKRLKFGASFNQLIEPGMLPSSLTELNIDSQDFGWPLLSGALPSGLVKLTLPNTYNHPIAVGVLPDTLECLAMASPVSVPLPRRLRSFKHLDFYTNGVIDASLLPDTLTDLSLGSNQLSGLFPSSVVTFTFQSIESFDINGLNSSTMMTHFYLRSYYDKHNPTATLVRPGQLPSSITHLETSLVCLPGAIPDSVTHLGFYPVPNYAGPEFDEGFVPNSVTHLSFGETAPWIGGDARDLPESVIDLELHHCSGVLNVGGIPASVKTLYVNRSRYPLHPGVIPASVETLVFGTMFDKVLSPGVIPTSVTKLVFLGPFKKPLVSMSYPLSQAEVTQTGGRMTHFAARSIPNSVVELRCYWPEDVLVPVGAIPDSVKKLSFGGPVPSYFGNVNSDTGPQSQLLVVGSIPSSVTELDMGPWFNAPIPAGIIPTSVRRLTLGPHFKSTLPPEWTDNPACYLSDESRCQLPHFN